MVTALVSGDVSPGSTISPLFPQSSYPAYDTSAPNFVLGNRDLPETATVRNIPTNNGFSQATQAATGGASLLVGKLSSSMAVNIIRNAANTIKQGAKELFGVGYPEKVGAGSNQQPFDPATGRYLSPAANPGPVLSDGGRFSSGFAQGYGEAISGNSGLATPVGAAGHLGHFLGTLTGNIGSLF